MTVDGRLDELDWQTAERFDGFRVMEPLSRAEPEHRSTLRVLARPEGLYLAMETSVPRELRVRGKSNGGLLLPALILHLASGGTAVDTAASPTARHASLRLHALAGRDLTRNESIRQLVRAVPARAAEDLQSLLHSTGESKLFAMDALTRMGDAEHLPTILSAMELSDPASVSLASSALDELMPKASRAVEANVARQLELVPDTVREDLVRTEPAGWHVRAAAALGLVLVGLFGFWMRGYRSRSCGTLLRTHSSSQAPRW